MKKNVWIALLLVCVCFGLLFGGGLKEKSNPEFLRIHIRADSNDPNAQDIKYIVKDAITRDLAPKLADCDTKDKAMEVVRKNLDNFRTIADNVLIKNGFDYVSSVRLAAEEFPERTYEELTLPAGVYDALIIELGSGEGQNWWCVVYPPLCFVGYEGNGGSGLTYRSKLVEIIESFFKNK